MICILLSDDGKTFKVIDPETKKEITESGKYECNSFVIQTDDGRWKSGFHIGVDCTEEIEAARVKDTEAALAAAEEHGADFIGDPRVVGEPKTGGRFNRG